MIRIIFIISILFCQTAYASMSDDLKSAFNKMQVSTNFTRPDVYKGQEGQFYFGGNAFVRTNNRSVQPMWFQPPGWRVGDCDMDLWTGGFGYINSDKFVQMARNIGTSSAAYFFSLALKQVAPQIMNQMEALQEMANKINQHNINSCEAGKYFVDSGIDLIRQSANRACQTSMMMRGNNDAGNAIRARDECNKADVAKQKAIDVANDPELKAQSLINKNIAWEAIENNPTLKALDLNTRYFLMSLTGTVVIKQPEGADAPTELVYISKLDANTTDLLDALSKSRDVKLYTCADRDKCLNVQETSISMSTGETIYGQVEKMLKSIEDKVRTDTALTDAEKNFIAQTDLEIYKLIKLQTAFTRNVPLSFMGEYVELISLDILYRYLDQCIGDVMQAFNNNQLPEKYSKKFIDMMHMARNRLSEVQQLGAKRLAQRREMMFRVQSMQNQLTANISSNLFSKMSWNNSLRN